ncbi:Ig-like domain-containing protein [Deefgea rivuli]|uniref:Ig-like domain-containing protein n=1 Tax=Deefgea rivuli TaxID=400948 RepID=UPI0004865D43|nr:Ig-like domain-containing protein [Deefgea rivuli]
MHAATNNFPSRQTLIRALIVGALSTTLVACGGGGPGGADLIAGGSSGTGGGGTATPAPSAIPGGASATVKIDSISASLASISANANTTISVMLSNNGKAAAGEAVSFTSKCATAGKATIDAKVAADSTGKAVASYTDKGCATTDTVTATTSNGQFKNIDIAIAAPVATSLQFGATTPADGLITLKGYGSNARPDSAQVTFKIVDAANNPIAGRQVSFALDSQAGGITLSGSNPVTTDANGMATATVIAGSQPTTVVVTATSGSLVSASNKLSISSGVPDDASMSISADKFNLNGAHHDGEVANVTVRLADHFGNPIPDGTPVTFITDYGVIGNGIQQTGSCTTKANACTVQLTSQGRKPSNGRVHVLAHALGEETYTDKNANNVADQDSELNYRSTIVSTDIGEAYLDTDENNTFNGQDMLIDFNDNKAYDGPDGYFNGTLCNSSTFAKCAKDDSSQLNSLGKQVKKRVNIFRNAVFTFSSDQNPQLGSVTGSTAGVCGSTSQITAVIKDEFGNPLPAGTKITFATTSGAGTIASGGTQTVSSGSIPASGAIVDQKNSFQFTLKFGASAVPCPTATTGTFEISVTFPTSSTPFIFPSRSYTIN